MLKNLTPNKEVVFDRIKMAEELKFDYVPQCEKVLEEGIYLSNGFDIDKGMFFEFDDKDQYETDFRLYHPNYEKSQYGVCDSIDQLKDYFKEEINDPINNYCIVITPIEQDPDNIGKGGGWRWHKWGRYIGELNPQYEYLDDEEFGEDFQCIFCFHIYKTN